MHWNACKKEHIYKNFPAVLPSWAGLGVKGPTYFSEHNFDAELTFYLLIKSKNNPASSDSVWSYSLKAWQKLILLI